MFSFFKKRKEKKKEKELEDLEFEQKYGFVGDFEGSDKKGKRHSSDKKDHLAVELCEQMIDNSRELENIRDEYRLVTNYLTDIQIIEELPVTKRAALIETAEQITKLNHVRDELMVTKNRISDSQYARMQEEEDEIPRAIQRLEANETYLSAINRDLHTLEGEKLSWNIEKKAYKKEMRQLGHVTVALLILFATLVALYLALTLLMDLSIGIPMIIMTILIVILSGFCFIRYQDCQKQIRQCDANINHAISLENHVKIKYVNIKNAVDYSCEKYHISNSKELVYIYEQYLDAVKERKRFRDANDDLTYYNDKLIRQLEEYRLYDASVWINYAHAICDPREMVEVKHNLIVRRQKLRTRMEYNLSALNDMKDKALASLDPEDKNRAQIEGIIRRLDQINNGDS